MPHFPKVAFQILNYTPPCNTPSQWTKVRVPWFEGFRDWKHNTPSQRTKVRVFSTGREGPLSRELSKCSQRMEKMLVMLCTHNVGEGRSLIFTMFTNVKNAIMWLDRRNGRCMHYHGLDNQWMESLLKMCIYSWGLGRGITMMPSYAHKHIMSEGCCLRNRWCELGFRLDDHVISSKVLVILISGTSGVGWLCLDHSSGVVGWNGFFYPFYFPYFYVILVYWLVIDS